MNKKRIPWVDIAKAIAIISVIISHTVINPSDTRTLLFSFHLPLFLILSGFTTKLATDGKMLWKRLKKNFLYILLPALVFSLLGMIIQCVSDDNLSQVMPHFKTWLFSSTDYYFGAGAMLWFLIALFNAKVIMDVIKVTFKTERSELFYVLLGLFGLFLGYRGIRLPLYLDLTFIAMLFIEVGIFWHRNHEAIEKYHHLILIGSLIIWFNLFIKGSALEMMIRYYPNGLLSLIESIAASYVVCEIAKIFEECITKNHGLISKIGLSLVSLGKSTIILYIIHSFDGILLRDIWDHNNGSIKRCILSVVLRLTLDILIFVVIRAIFQVFRPRQKQ